MRVIQTYTFKIGTKIPYSEYPAIVHRFLEEQNLVSNRFLYYFDELIHFNKTHEETLATGSCAKALKDCPALGEIRFLDTVSQKLFLSNIDLETGCTEADILPHMKKIHRRYGFLSCNLYYYDVDFFHDVIPFQRDMSFAKQRAEHFHYLLVPTEGLELQPYGSGIQLHRHAAGGNFISLSIDILRNGKIYDPTPYFDAMKSLLPKIHHTVNMKVYLTEDEQQEIAAWNKKIEPALKASRSFFTQHFPDPRRQNSYVSNYSIAPTLKKLAKQYDFSYRYQDGAYILHKRTPRGHVLRLWLTSGPSHYDTTYYVDFQGIGFCHPLCCTMQTPSDQAESDACAEKVLAAICEFEKTHIPELDKFYVETPEWYVPSGYWFSLNL